MAKNYWLGTTDGDWNTATNWSLGTVPVGTNEVVVPKDATVAILGYDASAAEMASFIVEDGCSIQIGGGSTGIPLTLDVADAGDISIGTTARAFLDGTLKLLTISGGAKKVVIPETATITTLTMTNKSAAQIDTAITTANLSDGSKLTYGIAGSTTAIIGTATIVGTGSTILYNSTGKITACTCRDGGKLDGSGDSRSTTIETFTLYGGGAALIDPNLRFTLSNGIVLAQGTTVTGK